MAGCDHGDIELYDGRDLMEDHFSSDHFICSLADAITWKYTKYTEIYSEKLLLNCDASKLHHSYDYGDEYYSFLNTCIRIIF